MFALLLSPSVLAESEYYTWVDEFGRVHNTPINPADKKDSKQSSSKGDSNKTSTAKPKDSDKPGFYTWVDEFGRVHNSPVKAEALDLDNADDYLSEEDYERQTKQDRKDNPEFYTWVDEQGRVRNQAVTHVEATTTEDAEQQSLVTDHTLVPPLRVSMGVQNASCCQNYASLFKITLTPLKSTVFSKPQFGQSFFTQTGNKPAWFFMLSEFKLNDDEQAEPVLRLRLRDTDNPMALIALNKDFQPLYSIAELEPQYHAATWRTVAMHETLVGIVDEEVRAVIVYFPQGVENKANLEVQWLP